MKTSILVRARAVYNLGFHIFYYVSTIHILSYSFPRFYFTVLSYFVWLLISDYIVTKCSRITYSLIATNKFLFVTNVWIVKFLWFAKKECILRYTYYYYWLTWGDCDGRNCIHGKNLKYKWIWRALLVNLSIFWRWIYYIYYY